MNVVIHFNVMRMVLGPYDHALFSFRPITIVYSLYTMIFFNASSLFRESVFLSTLARLAARLEMPAGNFTVLNTVIIKIRQY